jgi:hypothetical protein
MLNDRHIRVEQAKVNRTLFLARFSKHWSEQVHELSLSNKCSLLLQHLRTAVERYGPLEECTVLQNFSTGKGKGCGFIKFRFREDAVKAYLVKL